MRRVINEQAGDNEISQALDGLSSQLVSMMKNIVGKYPNLNGKATEAKTSLDIYINKAKKMQLESDDESAKSAFGQTYKLLTLGGKGGYQPYEELKQGFTALDALERQSGYLNQSYNIGSKPKIIDLINKVASNLRNLAILK